MVNILSYRHDMTYSVHMFIRKVTVCPGWKIIQALLENHASVIVSFLVTTSREEHKKY
jgi:hypothetical protein